VNTIKVIDAVLKAEVSTGPVWHRYTMDGYGETSDGGPFRQEGIGRGWPLLGGERAHYELARGNRDEARWLLGVMAKTKRAREDLFPSRYGMRPISRNGSCSTVSLQARACRSSGLTPSM